MPELTLVVRVMRVLVPVPTLTPDRETMLELLTVHDIGDALT